MKVNATEKPEIWTLFADINKDTRYVILNMDTTESETLSERQRQAGIWTLFSCINKDTRYAILKMDKTEIET